MRLVEVLPHPPVLGRRTQRLPPRRLVRRAAEPLQVHETLHHHDRMPVLRLPVAPTTAPGSAPAPGWPGSGTGPPRPSRQNRALLATRCSRARRWLASQPIHAVAPFQMIRRRRPPQQRHPLPAVLGHVAQLLAHHRRALEVVVFDDQSVPLRLAPPAGPAAPQLRSRPPLPRGRLGGYAKQLEQPCG